MSKTLSCWKCGTSQVDVIFPMSRREVCSVCTADQHVCNMCKEFDRRKNCNEPQAEDIINREKANFCDYFSPSAQVFSKHEDPQTNNAFANLSALFADEPAEDNDSGSDHSLTPAEQAERKLRQMLGD
jgi:hypothetical protein